MFDIDIDTKNRKEILDNFDLTIAAKFHKNKIEKHPVGVYFQNIPKNSENLATIDYKFAEKMGYIKFDFINNHVYSVFNSNHEIDYLLSLEPDFSLLKNKKIVENLFHIHDYYNILKKFCPENVDQLACFLALIRPGKKQLLEDFLNNKISKDMVMKKIWEKNNQNQYVFKKSHAYSYALTIVLQLNLIKYVLNG